jgi:thiamine pyrophosphokinase
VQTDQIKSILIVANGEPPRDTLIKNLIEKSDCIIAADGGSNFCYKKNIYPHFIIGDLDSIDPKALSHFKDAEIIRLAEQDTHDLDKAITFAKTLKPMVIRIVAAFGRRLDHSIANLLLLQSDSDQIMLEFYDDQGQLTAISSDQTLKLPIGQTVSLFSLLPVYGLSLRGFEYSLQNRDFPKGFNGLSNIIAADNAQISLKKGLLFLYIFHEDNSD